MSVGSYFRTALDLPLRVAARKGVELVSYRTRLVIRKTRDRYAPDPLADAAFRRELNPETDPRAHRFFDAPRAVMPVTPPEALPEPGEGWRRAIRRAADAALSHRFDLLGSGPVEVGYTLAPRGVEGHHYEQAPGAAAAAEQRERMRRLLGDPGEAYDSIDWHRDFKSGFRWDGSHVADLSYGEVPGVDIKVPWDLSRFQEVGALGLAWRLDPESEPGAAAPAEFRSRVVDWIAANPLRRGPNWLCAMDVGIRAVNWLIGLALMDGADELDDALRRLMAKALAAHGHHIEQHLEYSRVQAGNHYLADVVGLLAIAAALPELRESDRWLAWGLQELASEMGRQVRPDGADFEGSTGYHFLVSELFLTGTAIALRLPAERWERLARTRAAPVRHPRAPALREPAERGYDPARPEIFSPEYLDRLLGMGEVAASLVKPDGRIPLVGDYDSGRLYHLLPGGVMDRRSVPAVAGRLFGRSDLARVGQAYELDAALIVGEAGVELGAGSRSVPDRVEWHGPLELRRDTGWAVVRQGEGYLLMSFGTVPEENGGGHYHNDLLSFELQWRGVDLVVDGGSYLYTPVPGLRNAWRSTAAHSTIHVPGREQRRWPREPSVLFQVERDAEVEVVVASPEALVVRCAYAGVEHERRWEWSPSRLVVEDTVRVEEGPRAELMLNLAPGTEVVTDEESRTAGLEREGLRVDARFAGVIAVRVEEGYYSPGYGERVPCPRLVAPLEGPHARLELTLQAEK